MKEQGILSKRGFLLPMVIFLIVAVAALMPFLVQHSEVTNERTNYLDEWNKIEWAISGIKNKHLENDFLKVSDEPYASSADSTISYGDFHVLVSFFGRKTMLSRNLCFGLIPQVYRGSTEPYVDAGYDLSDCTAANTTSAPGVAAGGNHSFAWLANGSLYSWGNNSESQLGRTGFAGSPNNSPNLVARGTLSNQDVEYFNQGWLVAGGSKTSIAVDYQGKVYGWGRSIDTNASAPLLLNLNKFELSGVETFDITAGNDFIAILDKDKKIRRLSWGGALGQTNDKFAEIEGIPETYEIAGGEDHLLAITSNGDVWGYGSNAKYQLGRADTSIKGPIKINEYELVSEVPMGGSSGKNPEETKFYIGSTYKLAIFTVLVDLKNKEVEDGVEKEIRLINSGIGEVVLSPIIVEKRDKKTYALKFESSEENPRELGPATYTIRVFIDNKEANQSWYKNNNNNNQGVYSFYGSSKASHAGFIGVAAGGGSSFALKRNPNDLNEKHALYSWGLNDKGQLGLGHTNSAQNMAPVPDFAGNDRLRSVSAGLAHTLVLTEGGRVYSFGDNDYGQLGRTTDNNKNPKHTPKLIEGLLKDKKIISIAAGDYHSLAMDEQFNVYSWGRNDYGQLGLGSTADTAIPTFVDIGK